MSEMVERVGAAVVEFLENCDDSEVRYAIGLIFGLGSEFERRDFTTCIGRAAIAAMREPTEGMRAALKPHISDHLGWASGEYCNDVIAQIIDAALTPPRSGSS